MHAPQDSSPPPNTHITLFDARLPPLRHFSLRCAGARDGALMVWDARMAARADAVTGEPFHSPVAAVQDAHALSEKHRRRRTPLQGRTRPSVTSLAFLGGSGGQLATGGARRRGMAGAGSRHAVFPACGCQLTAVAAGLPASVCAPWPSPQAASPAAQVWTAS
jgi:hypothetical protein